VIYLFFDHPSHGTWTWKHASPEACMSVCPKWSSPRQHHINTEASHPSQVRQYWPKTSMEAVTCISHVIVEHYNESRPVPASWVASYLSLSTPFCRQQSSPTLPESGSPSQFQYIDTNTPKRPLCLNFSLPPLRAGEGRNSVMQFFRVSFKSLPSLAPSNVERRRKSRTEEKI
jgi:hypothetical protein